MNKKMIALAMVPILIGMTGVFAFSAYSGTNVTNIGQSEAQLAYTASVYWNQTSGPMSNVYQTNINGHMPSPLWVTGDSTSSNGNTVLTVDVNNLVQGEYVGVRVVLNNTGVGFYASPDATLWGNSLGVSTANTLPVFATDMATTGGFVVYSSMSSVTGNGIYVAPNAHATVFYILIGLSATPLPPGTYSGTATLTVDISAAGVVSG